MKTFVQDGKLMNYANSGSAILSGAIVQIGNLVGVAAVDIAATSGSGAVAMEGVFSLTKVGSQAWAQGDPVFYDHTNIRCTNVASTDADTLIGHAWEVVDSASGSTTGLVKLLEASGTKATVIAALTENAGAIGGSNDGDLPTLTATYTALTGSNSGTANGALEAEGTVSTAGGNTYADSAVNTVFGKIENNITELSTVVAQLAADNVNLRAAARENATKVNALIAALKVAGIMDN